MRVFGYVRLSRAFREESTSIARQREIIAQTASSRGWTLVDTLEDVDVSATKRRLDRPGLNELRRRIRAGEAEAVLVWRLDRLVRSVVDVGLLLDEGLQIVSATEPFDTTSPMGRAMVEVSQVFAALESKTIGVRVASSKAYLRKVGRWAGGPVPYGYRAVPHPDGVGRALEPDPEEAAVVRRMADEALAGSPPSAIARGLNRDGIRARRGGDFSPTVVRRTLVSGVSLGRVRIGRTPDRDAQAIRGDDGLPIVFWEPLLPVEDVELIRARWDAVTAAFPSGTEARWRNPRPARLLSGLLPCPSCGRPLVVRSFTDERHPPSYVCGASSRGRVCERGVTVRAEWIEDHVALRFLDAVGHHRLVEDRLVSAREPAARALIEEGIRDTLAAMALPGADLSELMPRLQTLHADRDRLDAQPSEPVVERVLGASFASAWADAAEDVEARRGLLLAAGVEVRLAHGPAPRAPWTPERVRVSFETDDGPLLDV